MNKLLISLALALAILPSFAATSIQATVNGMVCAFCAQGIEKRISSMPATKAVYVDLKKKTVAVEAKESTIAGLIASVVEYRQTHSG